ncbi:MAG: AI-2E family transporter [Planctomycetota bacterium]|jgi:predicted PurR-regulated permease PerM
MSEHLPLQRIRTLLLALIALTCAGFILYVAKSVILPFLLAFFAMTILSPLVVWLGKRGIPTEIGAPVALLVVGFFLCVVGLVFYLNVDSIIKAGEKYEKRANVLVDRGKERLVKWGVKKEDVEKLDEMAIKQAKAQLKAMGPDSILTFLTGVTSLVAYIGQGVLVLLFLLFMLFESARFHEKGEQAFGEESPVLETVQAISHDVMVYMLWKTGISLVTGFLTAMVCLIFGVDFPFFWGLLAFGFNFIPNLGSVVASVLPCLLALFQFDSPFRALGLLITLIGMQNVMGSLIEPKLMGRSLSVSPLLLLLSLVFWGWLWGVVGMILAVPFAVTIKISCQHIPGLQWLAILMEANPPSKKKEVQSPEAEVVPP